MVHDSCVILFSLFVYYFLVFKILLYIIYKLLYFLFLLIIFSVEFVWYYYIEPKISLRSIRFRNRTVEIVFLKLFLFPAVLIFLICLFYLRLYNLFLLLSSILNYFILSLSSKLYKYIFIFILRLGLNLRIILGFMAKFIFTFTHFLLIFSFVYYFSIYIFCFWIYLQKYLF